MNNKPILLAGIVLVIAGLGLVLARPPAASAAPNINDSPVHAGCYLARRDQCKIHVERFTLYLSTGQKLVNFSLIANRVGGGQTTIYDWRPDVSNPVPLSGSTYTPSLVAKDFAAICGSTYTVILQGQGSGDAGPSQVGATGQFVCPTGTYLRFLPVVNK